MLRCFDMVCSRNLLLVLNPLSQRVQKKLSEGEFYLREEFCLRAELWLENENLFWLQLRTGQFQAMQMCTYNFIRA